MRTRATFRARPASPMKFARRASTLSILSIAAALVVTNLTPIVGTSASWNDSEWDNSAVGTLSCADDGNFQTRGAGRLLGGGLLPANLDSVATAGGVTVTNDGSEAHPAPVAATSVGDAFVNPLDVEALSLVNLPLTGGTLDELLSLPLATEAGAVNQYALAEDSGVSQGASGVVNDSGVVQTENDDNGALPTLGTVKLSTLVKELTGEAIAGLGEEIADLQLKIGAVASRASLDACEVAWSDDIDAHLDREYAIAGLDAEINAPVAKGLSTTLKTALTELESSVDGLLGSNGVVNQLTAGVDALINSLGIGVVSTSGSYIDVDLSAARNLATAAIGDCRDPEISGCRDTVTLDLATGLVHVDLASLIGEAYGGKGFNGTQAHGLNGLLPNTELVLNGTVANALTAALTAALDGWVTDVLDEVEGALDIAHVHVELSISLRGTINIILVGPLTLDVAEIAIGIDGTLKQLLDGQLSATITSKVLPGTLVTGPLIATLVNPLINGILAVLVSGSGSNPGVTGLVGNVLRASIFDTDTGLVANLGKTLSTATAPVITALSTVLAGALGVDGLVSLRVNVQNDPAVGNRPPPDPPGFYPLYPDWETGTMAVPDDQYDVAALSIGILNALGTRSNVNLELARSSVGVSCAVGDQDSRCAAY